MSIYKSMRYQLARDRDPEEFARCLMSINTNSIDILSNMADRLHAVITDNDRDGYEIETDVSFYMSLYVSAVRQMQNEVMRRGIRDMIKDTDVDCARIDDKEYFYMYLRQMLHLNLRECSPEYFIEREKELKRHLAKLEQKFEEKWGAPLFIDSEDWDDSDDW